MLLILFICSPNLIFALTTTWNNGNATSDWSTNNNWDNGVPTIFDTAVLPGSITIGGETNTILINTGAIVAAQELIVNSPPSNDFPNSSGSNTFASIASFFNSAPFSIGANGIVVEAKPDASFFLFSYKSSLLLTEQDTILGNNTISEISLGKIGETLASSNLSIQGRVNLNSANSTFTGNANLSAAFLSVAADTALGLGNKNLNFLTDSTLSFTSGFALPNTRDLPISPGVTATIETPDINNSTTIEGIISGDTGAFTKSKPGELTLAGTNTFGGAITLSAGTLSVSSNDNLSTANQNIDFTGDSTLNFATSFTLPNVRELVISPGITATIQTPDIANPTTIAGVILGATGNLSKSGVGELILTGTNTYGGTTTLSAGKLSVSSNDNLSTGNGDVNFTGDSIINFTSGFALPNTRGVAISPGITGTIQTSDINNPTTIVGVISGATGNLSKSGAGELILTGTNTYGGKTTLSVGKLSVSSIDNLSTGNGDVNFTGDSILNFTSGFALPNTRGVAISTGITGTIQTPDINNSTTIAGIISGATGGMTKTGVGELILSGANTYGGTTTISAGTLTVGSTSLGSAGDVNFTGSSTLNFTSGATLVNTRNMALSAGITATLQTPDINNSTTIAGIISGATSTLIKSGSGELILSGANTYAGPTTVSAGTLSVTGALSENSSVSVGANGKLKGTGSTGPVTNSSGGTVAPGASIGTLNIVGNYTQGANSTLEIEIDSAGNTDLLAVAGRATVDGTVLLLPVTGSYPIGTSYRFLTAGTVTGTFARLIETDPASFQLSYGATFVDIVVTQDTNILPIEIGALRGNSRRAANYYYGANFVATNSDLLNTLNTMAGLPARYFETALIKVSPLIYGALPLVNLQNDIRMSHLLKKQYRNIQNAKLQNLRGIKRQSLRRKKIRNLKKNKYGNRQAERRRELKTASFYSLNPTTLWVEPIFFAYNQESSNGSLIDEGQPAFSAYTYGSGFGYGHIFADHWMINVGGGYTRTNITWVRGMGHGSFNTLYFAPSFGWINEKFCAYFLLQGSTYFYKMNRNIHYGDINRTANHRHNSYDALAQIGANYSYQKAGSNFIVQPDGEFNCLVVAQEGYKEGGAGALSLTVKRNTNLYFQPNVNIKFIQEIYTTSLLIAPQVYIGWLINIPVVNNRVTSSFYVETTASPDFFVVTYPKAMNQITLGFDVPIQNFRGLAFNIGYQANFLSQFQIHQATAKVEWDF